MTFYTITYEVEADSEYDALRKVRATYDEPQQIEVEDDEDS
jgi:hypothetical protein